MADPKTPEPEATQFPGLKDDSPSETTEETPPSRIVRAGFAERIAERPPEPILVSGRALKAQTRRDFLIYGAGAALAAAGFWAALPPETQMRLGYSKAATSPRKERLLNKALNFDDDVAAALYSPGRLVPIFDKSRAVPPMPDDQEGGFPVNYEQGRPDQLYGNYLPRWKLTLNGLASGSAVTLTVRDIEALIGRYGKHEQVTRLVCVEGWSVIGGWGGLRFRDLLAAFPPMPGARWAEMRADFNVTSETGDDGSTVYSPDPYYVSIDLGTARHPQTLLATEQSGQPLTFGHGAPLRLVAPMKLGLKNIKAITRITYTAEQPKDYWSDFRNTPDARGYSRYDGL